MYARMYVFLLNDRLLAISIWKKRKNTNIEYTWILLKFGIKKWHIGVD